MKIIIVLLSFFVFSCASNQLGRNSQESMDSLLVAEKAAGQRQLATEPSETSNKIFSKIFDNDDYLNRIRHIGKYTNELFILMEVKGHPRKRILQIFKKEIDTQLAYLVSIERNADSLPKAWLPQPNSDEYDSKIKSLKWISASAEVMLQLSSYLSATKVMDDGNYDQNIYFRYLNRALSALRSELIIREGNNDQIVRQAQFSFADQLASEARLNLYKVFTKKNRDAQKKVDLFFADLQRVRSSRQAQALIESPDMVFARSYLAYSESTGSSDIEGIREDMDIKIATYFGLEMIKYLYTHLN